MTFADFVERPIHVSPLLFERHDGKYILRHKQLHGELDDGFGVVLRLATDFVELLVLLALSRIYDAKVTQLGMRHFPVREGRRAKCPAVVCASNISLPIAD